MCFRSCLVALFAALSIGMLNAHEHAAWLQAYGAGFHAGHGPGAWSARAVEPRFGLGLALAPSGRLRVNAAWEWERTQHTRSILEADQTIRVERTAILLQLGARVAGGDDHQWWVLAGPVLQDLRKVRSQEAGAWTDRELGSSRNGWALRAGVRRMQRACGKCWWAVEPYVEYQLKQDHEGYFGNSPSFTGINLPDRKWAAGLQVVFAFG